MNKYFNIYSKRINRMNIAILVFAVFVLSKYFIIQLKTNTYLEKIIDNHGYKYREVYGKRGKILDTNNKELAYTINKYTLWVNTNINNNNLDKLANILSASFKKNKTYYINKLSANRNYIVLEKDINDNQYSKIINQLSELKECGLRIESKSSRLYKYNNFASQTIGCINRDGIGIIGVEKKFNNLLSGDTLKITLKKGAQGSFINQNFIENNSIDGYDIHLTIDIEIQTIIQEEIKKMVDLSEAKSGNGILMDPKTGNIIAIASIPDFDPNHYNEYNVESYKNRVISDAYEPGSTLKIVPFALSLELEKFSLNDSIYCEQGEFVLANNKILHDHEEHGILSLEDIMAYSSNIGFAKISEQFSNNDLYKFLKYFGFGTKTFISLNNESKGFIRYANEWSSTSKNYISIGQELSITNLQLALAYSAVANGGLLLRPNIIKQLIKKTNGENHVTKNEQFSLRRIMSKKTSKSIMKSLDKVIAIGTARELEMNNYKVAGKTGTAQKYINGEYSSYTSTFVSLFPKDNPEYVLVVSIDEPKYGYHWASKSAVPVSKEIITRMVISNNKLHYNIANKQYGNKEFIKGKELEINTIKYIENIFPDLKGKSFKEALKITSKHNVTLIANNNILSGKIISQSIKAGNKTKSGMICKIKMGML